VGSAGGVIALLIILPLVLLIKGDVIIRLSMVITAVFWAVAATPLALWLQEKRQAQPLPKSETYISVAVKQVAHTISTAGHYREMSKFMLAFLVYGCGVAIALEFAAIIGATLYGMKQEGIIIFAIIVQIANVIGAYAFGLLVQRLGAKPGLIASLVLMIGIVAALYASSSQVAFFLIGAGAGIAMAGIQSISRTTVGLFAPSGQTAEFFGFFTLVGRLSFWIGPAIFGVLAAEAAQWYEAGGVAIGPAEQQGLRGCKCIGVAGRRWQAPHRRAWSE
jgi:UMF1 family MFS transporter